MNALAHEAVSVYRAHQGTDTALIEANAVLVKRIAYHLLARLPASVDVDDLIQAGSIGLIEAARNFKGDRGASFETFAGIRIRGAMLDELRRGDWAPRSLHRRARDIESAIREIEQETGRAAKDSDVAERLGLTLDEYFSATADAARCRVVSVDEFADDDRPTVAVDENDPDQMLGREEFKAELAEAISGLPEREQQVMSMYYERQLNLKEIGMVLEVSESRVCQLHGQALVRLRARLGEWASVALD